MTRIALNKQLQQAKCLHSYRRLLRRERVAEWEIVFKFVRGKILFVFRTFTAHNVYTESFSKHPIHVRSSRESLQRWLNINQLNRHFYSVSCAEHVPFRSLIYENVWWWKISQPGNTTGCLISTSLSIYLSFTFAVLHFNIRKFFDTFRPLNCRNPSQDCQLISLLSRFGRFELLQS